MRSTSCRSCWLSPLLANLLLDDLVGLFTRLGALGMLVMTLVIQLFVFPDAWLSAHMFWATILFAVIALGPGTISLDHLIGRWARSPR